MSNSIDLLARLTESDYNNIADLGWPSYNELVTLKVLPTEILDRITAMLAETDEKRKKSEKFCAFAFHGREYRLEPYKIDNHNMLRCCGKTPDTIQYITNELHKGQTPGECKLCWKSESLQLRSQRQIMNSTLDALMDRDVINLYEDSLATTVHPTYIYKIEPSNICNSLCVTCSGTFSTAWQKLEKENGEATASYVHGIATDNGIQYDTELCQIEYSTAKFINFLGGETTIDKTNYKILEYLIKHKNTNCFISFTTHGNFNLTEEQKNLILTFPNIHFNFSIDALEKKFEYVRYPLSWEKLNINIDWCRTNNIGISVNWTLSNLNILYYDEIKSWLVSNQIDYRVSPAVNHKPIEDRSYIVSSLSRRVKDEIIKRNQSPEVKEFLKNHSELDDYHYRTFLLDILKQDRWKHISIYDYMPEISSIIHNDLIAVTR